MKVGEVVNVWYKDRKKYTDTPYYCKTIRFVKQYRHFKLFEDVKTGIKLCLTTWELNKRMHINDIDEEEE